MRRGRVGRPAGLPLAPAALLLFLWLACSLLPPASAASPPWPLSPDGRAWSGELAAAPLQPQAKAASSRCIDAPREVTLRLLQSGLLLELDGDLGSVLSVEEAGDGSGAAAASPPAFAARFSRPAAFEGSAGATAGHCALLQPLSAEEVRDLPRLIARGRDVQSLPAALCLCWQPQAISQPVSPGTQRCMAWSLAPPLSSFTSSAPACRASSRSLIALADQDGPSPLPPCSARDAHLPPSLRALLQPSSPSLPLLARVSPAEPTAGASSSIPRPSSSPRPSWRVPALVLALLALLLLSAFACLHARTRRRLLAYDYRLLRMRQRGYRDDEHELSDLHLMRALDDELDGAASVESEAEAAQRAALERAIQAGRALVANVSTRTAGMETVVERDSDADRESDSDDASRRARRANG